MHTVGFMKKPTKGKGVGSRPITPEALPEPKPTELLQKARSQALAGLSELVAAAIGTLRSSLIDGTERRQGSRSSDARYILDVVLDRIPAPKEPEPGEELDDDGEPTQTPVDELAERRAELQKLLRQQRRDMDKQQRGQK